MKKKICLGIIMAAFLGFMAMPASAWVLVPSYGDTGWQNYTYVNGPSLFEGYAAWIVSNQGDNIVDSMLLLDNLSQCAQAGNQGFEFGNYTGYTLGANSNGTVVNSYTSGYSPVYNPTEGLWFSVQVSFNDDTSALLNMYGNPGTNGSYLYTSIILQPLQPFSFDWAFLTTDYWPFEDFSKFIIADQLGNIQWEDGLGQLSPIPVPPAAVLFATGLLGLVGWRRFRKN